MLSSRHDHGYRSGVAIVTVRRGSRVGKSICAYKAIIGHIGDRTVGIDRYAAIRRLTDRGDNRTLDKDIVVLDRDDHWNTLLRSFRIINGIDSQQRRLFDELYILFGTEADN